VDVQVEEDAAQLLRGKPKEAVAVPAVRVVATK